MSRPNGTLDEETISSILNLVTYSVLMGFVMGKQGAILKPHHIPILMPHLTRKAKNSIKHQIFTPTLGEE